MGGGPTIDFPQESPQENQLRSEQVTLLRQQRDILSEQQRQQNLLAPIMFGAAGVTPVFGENPNDPNDKNYIVGFNETTDPLKGRQDEVASRLIDRQLAALKGELPDNPALLRDLATQERTLNETLRKELGSGYATGTAGGNRLDAFNESRNVILEGGRRGDLSLAEQLGLAREQANQSRTDALLARTGGVNTMGLPTAQGFGQAASGYTAPLQQLVQIRQGRMQGNIARAQMQQAETAMWLGFASDTIGAVAGAAAASSGRLKKNIRGLDKDEYEGALRKLRDTPITRYHYKWDPPGREPHIGPILEMSPKEIHYGDGTHVSLLDYAGLLHAGVKGLERKVDREVKTLRQMVTKGDA
jgi:hypothetical protein